jgi:integrase/recombinase XerD
MAQGKQAKVLSDKQQSAVLHYLEESRYPIRNKTIFLLSMKAGLRAKEIASLRWRNVCDVSGEISDEIQIEDVGSKGKGGRTIPLNPALREALVEYQKETEYPQSDRFLVQSERSGGSGVAAQTIVSLFQRWFADLSMDGASSHSGRRTFITNAAKKISTVGGSLRDIQQLAGHSSLQTTQRYIEGSTEAKKAIVRIV